MTPIGPDDLEAVAEERDGPKPRPKGSLPYLPKELDAEHLRKWLTLAFRPPPGWTVHAFERTGRQRTDPCWLTVRNGRDTKTYRYEQQAELTRMPRIATASLTDGSLAMPHLSATEVEDLWAALCTLGSVLSDHDERHDTTKWLEHLIDATAPLHGHTLVPDHRHAALMALRSLGEFTRTAALALAHGSDPLHQQRPVRLIDTATGKQWVRAGEAIAYVRWVVGVEPLSGSTFRARLAEVGVEAHHFEDYRSPHPKALLYQLTDGLIEYAGEPK